MVDLVEDRSGFIVDLARTPKYVGAQEDDNVTIAAYFCWSAKLGFGEKCIAKDNSL